MKKLSHNLPISKWILEKRQYGFTLVELMILMAIIAILSTMGVVGYIGFTKGARDAQRMADIATLDTIILDYRRGTGQYPTTKEAFDIIVKNANQNQPLQDPLAGKVACITSDADNSLTYCEYIFHTCDDGDGYLLSGKFETITNAKKYTTLPGSSVTEWYNIGRCEQINPPIPPPPPSIPDGELCENKSQCLPERVCVGPPEKKCRPKNNQTKGADCSENADCVSGDCNLSSFKCKK